jgi:hypothetical protein
VTVLRSICSVCGTHEACTACQRNREEASRRMVENTALREQVRALHKVVRAVRRECKKFRFPEEDRPELWVALREYDDDTITKMEEE